MLINSMPDLHQSHTVNEPPAATATRLMDAAWLDLNDKALRIKRRFLGMYRAAHAGHVGSSLSVAEILTFLRFAWMGPEDQLILSKGHAAAALYSVLAEEGLLTPQDIETFYQDGTLLAAHPPPGRLPHIPFATGSLGHGLSMACGLATAHRLKQCTRRVFCVSSDGDLNEGSTWEAALFLTHHALNQVVWIIDRNHIQGFGRAQDVLNLEHLDARLAAFGFDVFTADGHDFHSLQHARIQSDSAQRPAVIICHTTKGRGWPGFEDTVDCHYRPIPEEQHPVIHAELDRLHSPERSTVPSSNIATPNGPDEPDPQPTP